MESFNMFTGRLAPLDRSNVDTDAIIPKQYLKSIQRTGFGKYLFDEWRYLDKGEPGNDCINRPLNPDFILNEDHYKNATILITRKNFGCGSSREHAVWAISDYGFKAIIAESFAEIFYNNCFKNGLLPIVLSESQVQSLFEIVTRKPDYRLTIDLEKQVIVEPSEKRISFEINPYRKKGLMAGLDEIGETLEYAEDIISFESRHKAENPWLFQEIKD
tara:strand:- start:50 stop:700 length:651 start_codon:yes stop_codon:yes gene_type:complete